MTATLDGEKKATLDGDQLAPPDNEILPADPKERVKGSYFQALINNDPITLLKPLLQGRGYRLRWGDGRLTAEFTQATETPWHYVKMANGLDCYLWHSVLFNIVSRRTNSRFVPSPCQQCWKTVVRLKTIEQLFAYQQQQESFPFACKCGIELRSYTAGNYGAYHYAKSQEEGFVQFKYCRDVLEGDPVFEGCTILLKRGCTEYEREVGPSENWTTTAEQLEVEKMITDKLDHVPNIQPMPAHVVANVQRRWIEFAHSIGDMTYLKFTNGVPLERPPTTYHHLDAAPADPVQLKSKNGKPTGWWEYDGKKYHGKENLPPEALRNGHLRACGVPSFMDVDGVRKALPIHPLSGKSVEKPGF